MIEVPGVNSVHMLEEMSHGAVHKNCDPDPHLLHDPHINCYYESTANVRTATATSPFTGQKEELILVRLKANCIQTNIFCNHEALPRNFVLIRSIYKPNVLQSYT